jgi:hypothetical protein
LSPTTAQQLPWYVLLTSYVKNAGATNTTIGILTLLQSALIIIIIYPRANTGRIRIRTPSHCCSFSYAMHMHA